MRPHRVVGAGVEDGDAVVGPGEPVVHVRNDVVEGGRGRAVGGDAPEAQLVALTAVGVDRERSDRLVGIDAEVADREVVVPSGELVLVEHDDLAHGGPGRGEGIGERRGAERTAAVDAVLHALDRAGEVLVRTTTHRRGRVRLLHPVDDLVVELPSQPAQVRERVLGVRVLGREVVEHLGVVALAQPEPRVDAHVAFVDQPRRAGRCDRRNWVGHFEILPRSARSRRIGRVARRGDG
jgi:hypothetical protein